MYAYAIAFGASQYSLNSQYMKCYSLEVMSTMYQFQNVLHTFYEYCYYRKCSILFLEAFGFKTRREVQKQISTIKTGL